MTRVRLSVSDPFSVVRCLCLAFVLLTTGCAPHYWGRSSLAQPTSIDPGDPVWIWTRGGVEKRHAVVITQDSVSGIPFETTRRCTRCRRTIPRVQVDSMKHGYRTLAQDLTEGAAGIGVALLAEIVVCTLAHARTC
jgi:hypothetical protein